MNKSEQLCKKLKLHLYVYSVSKKAYTYEPHSEMWKTMDFGNMIGKQRLKEYIIGCWKIYNCKNWNPVLSVNKIYIDFTNPNNFIKLLVALGEYCEKCYYEFPLFIHKNFIDEALDKIIETTDFMEDNFLDKLQSIDFEYKKVYEHDRDYLPDKYKNMVI